MIIAIYKYDPTTYVLAKAYLLLHHAEWLFLDIE